MRIVFMGTPQFAVPALKKIASSIIAVVTQPDRPRGRGHRSNPLRSKKPLALEIPVFQPARIKDEPFLQQPKELAPDLIVVVALVNFTASAAYFPLGLCQCTCIFIAPA